MNLQSQDQKDPLRSFDKANGAVADAPAAEAINNDRQQTSSQQPSGEQVEVGAAGGSPQKRFSMYTSSVKSYQEAYMTKMNTKSGIQAQNSPQRTSIYAAALEEIEHSADRKSQKSTFSQRATLNEGAVRRQTDATNNSKLSAYSNALPQPKPAKGGRRTVSIVDTPVRAENLPQVLTASKQDLAIGLSDINSIDKVKKIYKIHQHGSTPQVRGNTKGFNTHAINRNLQSQVQPSNPELEFGKLREEEGDDEVSRFNTQRNQESEKLPEMKLPTITDGKKSMQKIESVLSTKLNKYQIMSLGARGVKRSQQDINKTKPLIPPSVAFSPDPQVKQKRNSQAIPQKYSSNNAGLLSKQELELKHELHKEIISLTTSYNQSVVGEHLSRFQAHTKTNSIVEKSKALEPIPMKVLIHQNSTGSLKSTRRRKLQKKGTSGALETKETGESINQNKKQNCKQQQKKEKASFGSRSNKKLEKMNHNLVYTNAQASVGGSTSQGLPVAKKKFPNRFPSTTRAPAEASSVTSGTLPSIVSPSQGKINKVTGDVKVVSNRNLTQGQVRTEVEIGSPILHESNERSNKKTIGTLKQFSNQSRGLVTQNTTESIIEVERTVDINQSRGTNRHKSSNRVRGTTDAAVLVSPSHRSDNFNKSSYSKTRKPDILSLSPRNKLNPYTQGSSTTKQRSLKKAARDMRTFIPDEGLDLPHHQETHFKNYTLTKKDDFTLASYNPAAPRPQQLENSGLYQDLNDSSRLRGNNKSTRSQAKRNITIGQNNSLNGAMKGINSTHVMPYQIKMKGAGLSSDKYQKSKGKTLNRSKLHTPVASQQVPVGTKVSQNPRKRQILANLQNKQHSRQVLNDALDPNHQNTTYESTQQIQMTNMNKCDGSKSHSRTGTRTGYSGGGGAQHDKSLNVGPRRERDARGYLRHTNSILPPSADLMTLKGIIDKSQANLAGQVNLSQNVSRVKKRLDVRTDNSQSLPGRNLSQLHSRQGVTNTATTSNDIVKKQSLSKPTMAEKTTEEDSISYQKEEGLNGITEEVQPIKQFILSQQTSQRNSIGLINEQNSRLPRPIQNLNQDSVCDSMQINQNRQQSGGPPVNLGSKLEPKMTKDSLNLKNLAVEKRLRNSETAPNELSPGFPKTEGNRLLQENIQRPPVPPANMPATRQRNNPKSHVVTQDKGSHTAGGMRKQSSHDQSFTGLQSRKNFSRENDLTRNKLQEQQAKAHLAQLRNFRNIIDTRRQKNPEKQPLELKEFMIGLQVGQGAFAIVRRAVHKQTKHVIAIKTYDKKNLTDQETQQAVHREINTLSDLWHPSIMKLHEVVDQRTHVHLVMEMCQGSSIYHHIKKQPDQRLPEAICKHIFRQLVQGVSYLHSKGYAHRDLKLDNILMDTGTKSIKIIDFGFSLRASNDQRLSVFCGTPHYMDPDIVRKQPYNGPAADVWACGVILYIIFVGKLPFFGEFEADLFRKIQNGKFTAVPSELGDEKIRSLFRRIFDVNSSTRYTAQQLLEHSWLREDPPKNENTEQERVPDQPQCSEPQI